MRWKKGTREKETQRGMVAQGHTEPVPQELRPLAAGLRRKEEKEHLGSQKARSCPGSLGFRLSCHVRGQGLSECLPWGHCFSSCRHRNPGGGHIRFQSFLLASQMAARGQPFPSLGRELPTCSLPPVLRDSALRSNKPLGEDLSYAR